MNKPITTLFMLMSVDGKISTGDVDDRDVDKDFPRIEGINNGLHQYYEIEQTTDLFSMNSGKVMAKVGVNAKKEKIDKTPVSFIIIDNKPHLTETGVEYFIKLSKTFFLVTTNKNHPAFKYKNTKNIEIIYYKDRIDFIHLFSVLNTQYYIESMTLQTGGTLNAILLRNKLIDKISIVVAPALIGGNQTPTLIDGDSLKSLNDLGFVKSLVLQDVRKLKDSYIQLKYDVVNDTKIIDEK